MDFYYNNSQPFSGGYGYNARPDVFSFDASGAFMSVMAVLLLPLIIYLIILYIFRSLGLYHLAKKRGIAHPWFAWIPFLSNYIIGRLINNKVVLGDSIVLKHAEFFLPFLTLISSVSLMDAGWIETIVSICVWVYYTSALWRLFKIYRPKSRASFTIWSRIIGDGFFIFAIRDDKPFDPLEPDKVYPDLYPPRPAQTISSETENYKSGKNTSSEKPYYENLMTGETYKVETEPVPQPEIIKEEIIEEPNQFSQEIKVEDNLIDNEITEPIILPSNLEEFEEKIEEKELDIDN